MSGESGVGVEPKALDMSSTSALRKRVVAVARRSAGWLAVQLWRYASPAGILALGGLVYLYVATNQVATCGRSGSDNARFCEAANGPLQRLLANNVAILKHVPRQEDAAGLEPAIAVETVLAVARTIDGWSKPATSAESPQKAGPAPVGGVAGSKVQGVPNQSDNQEDQAVAIGKETSDADEASKEPLDDDSVLKKALEDVGDALGAEAVTEIKAALARRAITGDHGSAWAALDAAETAARVYWMASLGGTVIALILLASSGIVIGVRAIASLSFEVVASILLLVGWALAYIATWSTGLIFLDPWPSHFVGTYLNTDLNRLLHPAQALFAFGAIAVLTGVSLRLVVPQPVTEILRKPETVMAPGDDKKAKVLLVRKVQQARFWLTEVLDDINLAILVVAVTLVLGIWQIHTLLSWPLALVGGCGEGQMLPEIRAACGTVNAMVLGSGLMGSLLLGSLVIPAMTIARGLAQRLAGVSSLLPDESDRFDPAALGGSAWSTIARIGAILAPLLPGVVAQVAQALGSGGS